MKLHNLATGSLNLEETLGGLKIFSRGKKGDLSTITERLGEILKSSRLVVCAGERCRRRETSEKAAVGRREATTGREEEVEGAGGGGVGRRMTRGHNASSSTGAGANGGSSASGASKRVSTTPKPPGDGSGRNTNNSRGRRRMNASRTPAATVKRVTGKRVMTRSKKEKELTSFKDENGEVYKTGGKKRIFAYSQET